MFNENKEVVDIKYDEEKNKRINLFDNIKSFLSLNKNNNKKVGIITIVILVVIAIIILLIIKSRSNRNYEEYSIFLLGNDSISMYVGDIYVEPGYTAKTDNGKEVTNKVIVTNTVDVDKVGNYDVIYELGNVSVRRKVEVLSKNSNYSYIYLKGKTVDYIKLGNIYNDPGYMAIDTIDGNITSKVSIDGKVDYNKVGTYKLIYSVLNSRGAVASVNRLVVVTDASINLTLNNTEYTNKNVIINVGIIDNYFDYLLLPNGEVVRDKDATYQVTSNGVYKFSEITKNGHRNEKSIEVKNIDKIKPTGSCTAYVGGGKTTIDIKSSDNVKVSYYKYNNSTYTSNRININAALSNVRVEIFDVANNSTLVDCKVVISNPPVNPPSSSNSSSSSSSSSKPSSSNSSSSSSSPSKPSSSNPIEYDVISNKFSDNKHIADFLYQFESTPGTCSGGYKIKKFSSSTYTTAYGITNHLLKDYSSYNLLPCSTVSSNNKKYFTRSFFENDGACIPKTAVQEAVVCIINYNKNAINNILKKCNMNGKLTKDQMASLVDFGNNGIKYLNTAVKSYCNAINKGKSQKEAADLMFKQIFLGKNGNNRSSSYQTCLYIRRRDCEARLYFEGDYSCGGQDPYGKTFKFKYTKYHDNNSYSCK